MKKNGWKFSLALLVACAAVSQGFQPPKLKIQITSTNTVALSLTGPSGHYAIQWSNGSNNWRTLATLDLPTASTFVDTNAPISGSRFYRLELLTKDWRADSVTAGAPATNQNQPSLMALTEPTPGRITNLTVSAISSSAIEISWSDSISAVPLLEYDLRISTVAISALNWKTQYRLTGNLPLPGVAGTKHTYTASPLLAATRYYFAIKVKGANGVWSAMSNLAKTTTRSGNNSIQVSLAWDASPDSSVTGYRVYYGQTSRVYVTLQNAGNNTGTTISNLSPTVTYYFAATAYNADGMESEYSNEISFTCPSGGMPPSISVIADQTTTAGKTVGPLAFTVTDAETLPGYLLVNASSSNTTLIPATNVVFGGSGANRTVKITPATGQTGVSAITVTVKDKNGNLASRQFTVTVI